jgi:CelD/BcsL family acetyltransferase involved in cellulose biosynthesis
LAEATSRVRDPAENIDELLERQAESCVFVHPAWLRTWLSEFGEGCEPVFLDAGDKGIRAVAPLMRADERLTFIGDSSICDCMDFVVAPGESEAAYDALWQSLEAEEWRELDLWGLRAHSPTRDAIAERARRAGYEVVEEEEAVSPRVALPENWDAYLASLSKKDRHELRRKFRRLLDGGAQVELLVYSEQAEVVAQMDVFFDLHTRSRQDKTEFMTPEMTSFFRRMASAMSAEGLVRLFVLNLDRKPVASVFCFDAGGELYLYNSGYDPEFSSLSVGLVSKALCLQWAIENGRKGVDFLRGNEAYKYDLGAKDQQIYRLVVRRPA